MAWRHFRKKTPETELTNLIERLELDDYILEVHAACGKLTFDLYRNNKSYYFTVEISMYFDKLLLTITEEHVRLKAKLNGCSIGSYVSSSVKDTEQIIRRILKDDNTRDV